jgi:cyclophilin family peptidyl-prolyl cis-trans isomerase
MQNINREHPEYVARKAMWKRYKDLYAGGERIRENAPEYLVRRHKEPNDIYGERLSRVFYENYIGSAIDWYAATLMRREATLLFDGNDAAAKSFYSLLTGDCDLKGTNLHEFFRRQFIQTLVCGSSYVVVDFPRASGGALTRAEEDASGRSRAFLVDYGPDEVINWNYDPNGGLEWAVIRTSCLQQSKVTDAKWERETRWIYYDRERFQVFRKSDESGEIEMLDEGRHGLAGERRVPMFRMEASEGLWLMNKAALVQLEHFNKSNALAWALTMGLFASPVVYSEREFSQVVGESYYIQLGPEDRFGWTEPEGKVYQIAADNLVALKDEIYRVCYSMAQAGGSTGGSQRQSALSKQMDFSITEEVLRAYGDMVKETMKQVLWAIAAARRDDISIEVSGLDEFDIQDYGTELDDAKKLLDLGIGSETLKKQIFKRLALKYLCDARQEVKNQVAEEIDRAPAG